MTDSIIHRGPDGDGLWLSENKKMGLGHRRLSIIDLSDAASQPMISPDGRFAIVLNGEIYNYIELKNQLVSTGYTFRSSSDTEVLLALFATEGPACLQKLDGMFAFAVYDNVKQELFCARDRFGEKPFYFNYSPNQFLFASEIKALFAAGVTKEVSSKFVFNYLLYGVSDDINEPANTFYAEVKQLEPAHCITVTSDGKIIKQKYWLLDYEKTININISEAIEQYRFLFRRSVERRLRSDVPVGSSLSGGLDSSSVVLEVNRIKGQSQIQKTFSARFPGFVRDESRFMDLVNNRANVQPVSIFPTADSVMRNLEKIWYHQEIPFGSTSIGVQFEVMKAARDNGVLVLLDGQGADETMAGYTFYRNTYLNELRNSNSGRYQSEVKALKETHQLTMPAEGMKQKILRSGLLPVQLLRNLRKQIIRPDSSFFLGIHPDLVREYKNEPSPFPVFESLKEHLFFSSFKIGLTDLLRYADRNAMAHSVEVRLPFLSHELVEFVFSLPNTMFINEGWSKYILRRSMEDVLPTEIAWRKDKVGYEPPQTDWFSQPQYISIFSEAQEYLMAEKVINRPNSHYLWQHLMISKLLKTGAL
jgi:asparagine synthase (glutamine-hydrolysing)